jgi:predicted nucleotidyltransferase
MTSKDYIISTIQTHKGLLKKMGLQSVGIFGSYGSNNQSDSSDIDILIDFYPEQETFDNYMAICDYLENLFKNEKLDIVTKNGLSPYIGPKILEEVIYV